MNYPFKNLVFKGGGIRGIAYLGALEVINEKGLLEQAENVAGASAGAITALLVSLGYSFEEIKNRANALDYKKIQQEPINPSDKPYLTDELKELYPVPRGILDMVLHPIDTYNKASAYLGNAVNLRRRFGLYSNEYIYNWFGDQIEEKCKNRKATFKDLVNTKGCKNLSVTVTNVLTQSTHICNANHTPDLEVATAVLASMSIPMFFEAVLIKDNKDIEGLFVDGGVMHNFPISIYDYNNRPNFETLGLFIYSEEKVPTSPFHLKNFMGNTIASLLTAQDWEFARTPNDIIRTIQMSDCGVSATNFDVVLGDQNYNSLYEAGREGAIIYFDNYHNDRAANLEIPFLNKGTKHLA
jgi:NTE family protein